MVLRVQDNSSLRAADPSFKADDDDHLGVEKKRIDLNLHCVRLNCAGKTNVTRIVQDIANGIYIDGPQCIMEDIIKSSFAGNRHSLQKKISSKPFVLLPRHQPTTDH